jgi:hypothetical protein
MSIYLHGAQRQLRILLMRGIASNGWKQTQRKESTFRKQGKNKRRIIIVEKILAPNANLNKAMLKGSLAFKQLNSYSSEQIEKKRQNREGITIP